MKKILLISALGLIPAVAFIGNTYAQQSSVRTLLVKGANYLLFPQADTATIGSANLSAAGASSVNVKASRNFDKTFKGAINVSWAGIVDGFSASFTQNENFNRAYFDKKGNLTYTITYYDGKKLPHDIRAIVKSTYYDCDIPFVEEIHTADKIVYLVHLQDEKTWKKVKVCDGQMELIEDLDKN